MSETRKNNALDERSQSLARRSLYRAVSADVLVVFGLAFALFVFVWAERGRSNTTQVTLHHYKQMVEYFHHIRGRYPSNANGLDEIWKEGLSKRFHANDAWGRPYRYFLLSENNFSIRSLGRDGELSADDIVVTRQSRQEH